MDADFMTDPISDLIILLISFCAVLMRVHVRPQILEYMTFESFVSLSLDKEIKYLAYPTPYC